MNPGSQRFGRYRLLRRIGQGGMAEVYLAESAGPGGFVKRIALKRLLPHYEANHRFVSMLRDEAQIAAAIRHPNVAEVIDFGVVEGTHYIAMEFIDGVDLAAVLRTLKSKRLRLPLAAALYIGRCVAEGLQAAHSLKDEQGRPLDVIHRDVSPHNILISYEGAVKLIDFGVAKAANNSTHTKSGVIKGKLQYMSPEQAQAKPIDVRADVFSLGLTLYKLITGKLPFTGRNEYQVYDQILRKRPASLRSLVSDLPDVVDAIVLKSLRKDRERRYQSAGEMARVLDIALGQLDPEFGARELGELISREVGRQAVVPYGEHDDDLDDASAPSSEDAPAMDDESIDRLTRIDGVDEAMRAALAAGATRAGATKHLPLAEAAAAAAGPAGADEVLDSSLPPTMALPAVPKALVEAARAAREEKRSAPTPIARPVRKVLPIDGEPTPVSDSRPGGFHRARTEPTARLPPSDQPASVPSMHTSQLKGLRPRRWRYVAALLLAGVATAVAVVTLNRSDLAAATAPDASPVILDARFVQAVPLDATVAVPLDAALVEVRAADAAVEPAQPRPGEQAGARVDAAVAPVADPPPPEPTAVAKPPEVAPDQAKPEKKPAKRREKKRTRGYLSVNALPWAHVEVGGRRIRHTPLQRHPLRAGRHRVKLVGPKGQVWSTTVTIRAGQEKRITHAF